MPKPVFVDQTGAIVPDATLELTNVETNDVRRAATESSGSYQFQNLCFGRYQLSISKAGFESLRFGAVEVQTARVTDIRGVLKVGHATQTVQVSDTASPVIEASSNALSTTIDTKQVVNLPLQGRDVTSLQFLVPGWTSDSTSGVTRNGTFNNMPGAAIVSTDFDGTPGTPNRFRSGGFNYGTTAVQPRIENVGEMTIQTAQIDLSGTGTAAMRVSIVSRRGTNEFHGHLFEDFRNTSLNANSWYNNATGLPRNRLQLNDFGGSLGGPILRDKLFFYGTWAQSMQPVSNSATAPVLSADAQNGIFKYLDNNGNTQSVNVLQLAGSAGYRSSVLPSIGTQLQKINSSLSAGVLTPTSDPNLNTLSFLTKASTNVYYPSVRVDYNATQNLRIYGSYSQTKSIQDRIYPPNFPGGVDIVDNTSHHSNARVAGLGIDWNIRPTLINSFHAGYLYSYNIFDPENLGIDLSSIYTQQWNYGQSLYGNVYPRLAISSFYPMLSANDSLNWQKGSHSLIFGGSWYREQDHYWNNPGGFPSYNFYIAGQDPVASVFTSAFANTTTNNLTNAENLYAELTGRIGQAYINTGRPLDPATKQYKPFGQYNLDEIQSSSGIWFQDSWKLRPNLTLNYGLRWDFVQDTYNINGTYSTLKTVADAWGPTPVGAMFQPGVLGGPADPQFVAQKHAYNPSYVNSSPAIGIAWNPQAQDSFGGKLLGRNTVIRAGYSLRQYQEGAQNYWAYASNSGQFFYQSGNLYSSTAPGIGNFAPGSLTFGDALPPWLLTPPSYSTTTPASDLFPGQFWKMNPNIRQPYVEQWNFGIQRQLGTSSALEVRYVGNLSLHQWLGYNLNEVNTKENGFLNEFQNAEKNLAVNRAAGKGDTFEDLGVPGSAPLPILTAAFGGPGAGDFTNGSFIQNLTTGAAGAMANALATNTSYYCNMVGSKAFPACTSQVGNVPGAGYPVNFWQVNPYAPYGVNYLDSMGSSNYHALQVEFRQRPTHGVEFNVNYSWSHSLGIAAQNGIQSQNPLLFYTNRNYRLNYGPSLFDIRHVVHASGTYDLPFGKGRAFFNNNGFLDRVVGGWTLGTIIVLQTGAPFQINGGFDTLNQNDSGIYVDGSTMGALQKSVGVHKTGNPWVELFGPQFIAPSGAAAPALAPANVAGVLGYRPYIYQPSWYNVDLSINKAIPITERVRFSVQAEMLNAFNHPTFGATTVQSGGPNDSVQNLTFGQLTGGPSNPRVVEFRANLTF